MEGSDGPVLEILGAGISVGCTIIISCIGLKGLRSLTTGVSATLVATGVDWPRFDGDKPYSNFTSLACGKSTLTVTEWSVGRPRISLKP